MALVRRSVTELMKVIEYQRRITISPIASVDHAVDIRSLDHYSSALLYSCLYSALDTLPCALLVLYRLYPRRATPPGARHLPPFRFSPSHLANRFPARERESETAGAAARKLHARKHVTPKGRRSQEEEAGGRGGIFSLPGSRFTTGFITTTDATF